MDDVQPENQITSLPFSAIPNIPPPPEDYTPHRLQHTPLIIDNGSTNLRWGFATSSEPRFGSNIVTKYRERKTNYPLMLFGDAVEVESGAKTQAKTPWEGDVLLNFDALENALDYALVQLGIDTPTVEHPVLMTERLCSPVHSRALTSELMFELYSVPSLAYCVDGIMSFYQNDQSTGNSFTSDGLVVSFNTASTSVIPILNGKGIISHAKRIPWGASQATDYLLKLIQMKYPNFPTRVSVAQANWMFREFCSVSPDYLSLLRSFEDPSVLRSHQKIIQFPFLPTPNSSNGGATGNGDEKTEEELARVADRRREQGRKLQEIAARNRMEKLQQKESDLAYLLSLRDNYSPSVSKREWDRKLKEEGFDDEEIFEETLKKLEADVKKARKKEREKEGGSAVGDGDDVDEPMEEPSFPLVDIPDADLDPSSLLEKRKQKLLKAGYEARLRARKERELKAIKDREEKAEREKQKEIEEKLDSEAREVDLEGWAKKLRGEQETLMVRIKDRAKRRAAMNDRKSAAKQERMKNIANLAAGDERVAGGSGTSKKGGKGTGKGVSRGTGKGRKGNAEDMFGADDADWAIYRKINTTTMVSSDEEEDLAQLQQVEQRLLTYDPTFTTQHTHASILSQRSALLNAFRPAYEEGDVAGHNRIHLTTERCRVCEAWFTPAIAGVDSAGLGEVIQNILSRFNEEEKARLIKNVFLTGSPSQIPGIAPRLYSTLRPLLPPEMPIKIRQAGDPALDAWKGMARFATMDEQFGKVGMSKAEYEEMGGERLKRWWGSNWNGGL
ncbi:chromatin remodeling complex subunit [Lentinula aff. detonsa]|uniref:Chromatin remodeling complex subunit n=1 Tax=Lentinula aff. detonsa TaxID=2804958 RepID=A0AA38K9T7_9AGAR|nr:chromatin remodeling complex subunit [Lentinula aff. detonsa]